MSASARCVGVYISQGKATVAQTLISHRDDVDQFAMGHGDDRVPVRPGLPTRAGNGPNDDGAKVQADVGRHPRLDRGRSAYFIEDAVQHHQVVWLIVEDDAAVSRPRPQLGARTQRCGK